MIYALLCEFPFFIYNGGGECKVSIKPASPITQEMYQLLQPTECNECVRSYNLTLMIKMVIALKRLLIAFF